MIVSKGPSDVDVPNVEGLDEETARTQIEDAGLDRLGLRRADRRPGERRLRARPGSAGRRPRGAGLDGGDLRRAVLGRPGRVSRRPRVAVVMGGRSSEHEISLASAASVLGALESAGYEAVPVEIGRDGRWSLPSNTASLGHKTTAELEAGASNTVSLAKDAAGETLPIPADGDVPATLASVDVVLPILHGPFGEDGTVQGLLELADVPYVGPGVAASALCMDKDLFKKVLRDSGIPVARAPRRATCRPDREPVRLPGLRQARPAWLVGRDHEGALGRGARAGGRAGARARREGADRGVRRPEPRSSAACSATSTRRRSPRSSARSSRTPSGTTTRPSTTRAAWI